MNQFRYRLIIITAIIMVAIKGYSQTELPEELTNNKIDEQLKYLEDRTRIYENYRAIREDMFQRVNRNIRDTIAGNKSKINELINLSQTLRNSYDSLYIILETTTSNLKEITATKNSIRVLGMEVNKVAYNTIMWSIILILVSIFAVGFIIFKRNIFTTMRTGKELKELKEEFEAYRQSTRIAREKAQLDHFNEIKKLKGR